MPRIAHGGNGTIKWQIDYYGPALDYLTDKNRNALLRDAFNAVGKQWISLFLPKRFSDYVDRSPFPYPRHRLGFYFAKAKRMGIVRDIIKRLPTTKGWDPWSTEKPPLPLIIEWKKLNPGKYNLRNTLFNSGLIGDMRRNAKRMVFEIIEEMSMDGKFIPLVEKGIARGFAKEGAKARSTVTSGNTVLRISVPFGHPVNPTVSDVVKTVPTWEIKWIAQQFGENIKKQLLGKGLSVNTSGVVTTRAVTAAIPREG